MPCGGGGGGGGGDIFCGGGTKSASKMCPPGQNPLADSVRGDNNWGGGGGGGGGTKSAMTPAYFTPYMQDLGGGRVALRMSFQIFYAHVHMHRIHKYTCLLFGTCHTFAEFFHVIYHTTPN